MYNPANPAVAVMVEDYYTGAHIMLGIGGTFVLLGSLVAYLIRFSAFGAGACKRLAGLGTLQSASFASVAAFA